MPLTGQAKPSPASRCAPNPSVEGHSNPTRESSWTHHVTASGRPGVDQVDGRQQQLLLQVRALPDLVLVLGGLRLMGVEGWGRRAVEAGWRGMVTAWSGAASGGVQTAACDRRAQRRPPGPPPSPP